MCPHVSSSCATEDGTEVVESARVFVVPSESCTPIHWDLRPWLRHTTSGLGACWRSWHRAHVHLLGVLFPCESYDILLAMLVGGGAAPLCAMCVARNCLVTHFVLGALSNGLALSALWTAVVDAGSPNGTQDGDWNSRPHA